MIHLTEAAANRIKELFKEESRPETSAIRFLVKGGGCAGFEFDVDLEPPRKFDMAGKHDNKFLSKDVRILVDSKSLIFLTGMTVDFEKTRFGHRFVYNNPNASGYCGCGTSFST